LTFELRKDAAMSTDIKVDLDRLVAEMHDPEEPAAVVQAYLKLVDCIATHRPTSAHCTTKIGGTVRNTSKKGRLAVR